MSELQTRNGKMNEGNWLMKNLVSKEMLLNKASQREIIDNINSTIVDGEVDPLMVDVILKTLENIITGVRKNAQVKELVLDEASKYEGNVFDRFGAKITVSQKTTYDYKEDIYWAEMKSKIKERETLLKTLPQVMTDPETGEITTKPKYKITRFLKIEF